MKHNSSELVNYILKLKSLQSLKDITSLVEAYNSVYEDESINKKYMEYPLKLMISKINSYIESQNSKDTDKIYSIIESSIDNDNIKSKVKKDIESFNANNRVANNYNIINRRFNSNALINKQEFFQLNEIVKDQTVDRFIFKMCSFMNTYNLPIQHSIIFMIEELMYIFNINLKNKSNIRYYYYIILEDVLLFVFGTYPMKEEEHPDIVTSVIDKASFIFRSSLFIKSIASSYEFDPDYLNAFNYAIGKESEIASAYNTSVKRLIPYVYPSTYIEECKFLHTIIFSFDVNNVKKYIQNITKTSCHMSCFFRMMYYFFIYRNDVSSELFSRYMREYVILKLNNKSTDYSKFFECFNKKIVMFKVSLRDDIIDNSSDVSERSIYIKKSIEKEMKDSIEDIRDYYYGKRLAKQESVYIDEDDNEYIPFGFSDYEKKLISKICEYNNFVESLHLDRKRFNNTFGNPKILSKCDNSLIKCVIESYKLNPSEYTDTFIRESFNMAYDLTNDRTKETDLNNLSDSTNWFNKTNLLCYFKGINCDNKNTAIQDSENTKSMHASLLADINQNAKQIIDNIDSNIKDMKCIKESMDNVNYLTRSISKELSICNEMKISSYVSLALDKAKEGYDTLNDKQKEAFNTIDRIGLSMYKWDTDDEKDEARLRVVQDRMLPSLSKALKTLLAAGLIGMANIYLGILYVVVKIVRSKRATDDERQAVADELEVEIEMIDRRINEATENREFKKERKLRLLKKKMMTQYGKLAYDNDSKWNKDIVLKNKTDSYGSNFDYQNS